MTLHKDVMLDFAREARTGLNEAIFCAGKTVGHIEEILRQVQARGAHVLLTRLSAEQHALLPEALRARTDYCPISRTGFFGGTHEAAATTSVAVVAAGTSDVHVAREAARTLRYYGEPAVEITDVGVAGLWRLLERVEEIRRMRVVIAVAGMDAALPTVIGGLVSAPVIGVPTSVGYGAAEGGNTALKAMLASCAPGLLVTNIDNGYGAACAALRILRGLAKQP
ncbi:MAG TPA: nickel pincer cofactor biosynthesis protein LarB [Burkholderiales bacterium]|jgi:NCAIR mutase (PurE)-related protein|nr:nickel pincer cofactor biosynthesis protein LarB [Burkholderiales bacterium]